MTRNNEPIVLLKDVFYQYSTKLHYSSYALRALSLTVKPGELVTVIGRSGSGKSTLLKLIGGFLKPQSGVVRVHGRELSETSASEARYLRRTLTGMIFQDFGLIDELTALENVVLQGSISERAKEEGSDKLRERAEKLLCDVGLADRMNSNVVQLSGGEKQRVAIARALVLEPRLILADEPTGNLDTETGRTIVDLLLQIKDRQASAPAIIMVTHDVDNIRKESTVLQMTDGTLVSKGGNMP